MLSCRRLRETTSSDLGPRERLRECGEVYLSLHADIVCAQKGSIPVCVKAGLGEWLCGGYFKLVRSNIDLAEIARHAAVDRRADINKLLFLEEVAA